MRKGKKKTDADINRIVGENIRRQRGVLGLTAEFVCFKANLSKGFFSDVENGKRGISSINLFRVAQAVGCTINDLLEGVA